MKKQALVILIFLGLLAGVAFFMLQERQFVSEEVSHNEKLVFPGLPVSELNKLVVSNRFGTLTFLKQGNNWVILEKDNYLADAARLHDIFSLLAELQSVQKTEVDESQWERLGVEDPMANGGTGKGCRVDLFGANGYHASLIVGTLQASDSEASIMFGDEFDGRSFVRIADSDEVRLVGSSLAFFNTIPSHWIMNILSNPYAYRRITYVIDGEPVWVLNRSSREEPYTIVDGQSGRKNQLLNLTQTVDYAFASMFIKDVLPGSFERENGGVTGEHYFELEALDGFTQRIYLGGKTEMSEQERLSEEGATGVLKKVRAGAYRYAFIEWLTERIEPPINEPPYSGRTYLVNGPKMDDFLINYDEMLVFERLSPSSDN
ncbi:MAG: DUF4340 domain-containing protein [Verrucomicrobiota bacterium]